MTQYAFIGAGNMSKSIISGMLKANIPADSIITSTHTLSSGQQLVQQFGVRNTQDNNACLSADVIILAVKPQILVAVLAQMDTQQLAKKLIISVIAGIPCQVYYKHITSTIRLIRSMPNMPSQIGQGMTGMYATEHCSNTDKAIADNLMRCCGKTLWVEKEIGINYVNAISGSGPAYVYAFIHHLATAGEQLGLCYQDALTLALQTLAGSTALANEANEGTAQSMQALITQIAFEGGTTYAAMQSFENDHFDKTILNAVRQCYNKAIELGNEYKG